MLDAIVLRHHQKGLLPEDRGLPLGLQPNLKGVSARDQAEIDSEQSAPVSVMKDKEAKRFALPGALERSARRHALDDNAGNLPLGYRPRRKPELGIACRPVSRQRRWKPTHDQHQEGENKNWLHSNHPFLNSP